MKRKITFLIILTLVVLGIIGVLFLMGAIKPGLSLLRIESTPQALVYVNGQEIGLTPIEQDFEDSEVTVKLVPQSEVPLSPYEVKLNLTSGVKTILRRNIGQTNEISSGVIISFEKEIGNESPIAVVTTPDGAQVKINNQSRGVAPIKISDLSPGTYELNVSAMGYNDENITVQTRSGYRLTAIVALAANGGPTQPDLTQSTPTPAPQEQKQVKILETPNGFLRVRSDAATSSAEVARVDSDKSYVYLEENSGWIKIEYEVGKSGWISSEYASVSATQASP